MILNKGDIYVTQEGATFKCGRCGLDLTEALAFGRWGFGFYLYCPGCEKLIEKMPRPVSNAINVERAIGAMVAEAARR
jgi:hypothetical protein